MDRAAPGRAFPM